MAEEFIMRKECSKCGYPSGRIETRNNQDCVFCGDCGAWQYNAPKTETGKAPRTIATTHAAVKPKAEARIMARDGFACVFCHRRDRPLQLGHLMSVKSAHDVFELGWLTRPFTDQQINSEENLAAMCETCNIGLGRETVPLYLLMGIFLDRISRRQEGNR